MKKMNRYVYCAKILPVLAAGMMALPALARVSTNIAYKTENIVSNVRGEAQRFNTNVVNPWGVAFDGNRTYTAENGLGVITLLNRLDKTVQRATITVPVPAGNTNILRSGPTGLAFNTGNDFIISNGSTNRPRSGRSVLLFATEEGTIGGWNSSVSPNGVIAVNNSNAVYTALALAGTTNGDILFAANFRGGVVEAYDTNFTFLGSFTDTNPVAAGYAPYGLKIIQQKLFVAFAKQLAPGNSTPEIGAGNGFIDIFNLDGELVRVVAEGAPLNAPWAMALAPKQFGIFSGNLLVGNTGDGVINVYNILTGEFLGPLTTNGGSTLAIPGLRSLDFGREPTLGSWDFISSALLFTAGSETNGLIGNIRAVSPLLTPLR